MCRSSPDYRRALPANALVLGAQEHVWQLEEPELRNFFHIIKGFTGFACVERAHFWNLMTAPAYLEVDGEPEFKVLTAEEARRLRLKNPPLSPWRIVAGQVVVGVLAALLAWVWTGQSSVGWSVAYGALVVVLPAALFARGLMGRLSSVNPASAVAGFFLWEMVKLGLSFALLALAPRMVPGLNWLAMLGGLVVTMKVYWVALSFAPKR